MGSPAENGTSNSSGVSGLPPWPPELQTRTYFNHTDSRPNPIDVYCNVIEALFRMSLRPWNGLLEPENFALIEHGQAVYSISRTIPSEMRTKYLFQATVELLVAMKNDGWYSGASQVFLNRRPFAIIVMAAVGNTATPEESTAATFLKASTPPFPDLNRQNKVTPRATAPHPNLAAEPWRTIVDPQMLPDHIVRWRYDPAGRNIPSHELFMMFADGLAEVAQHPYAASCAAMDATGPSGIAVFYLDAQGRGTPLRWYEVAAAMAALALEGMVPARRFAEVEFELLSGGAKLGSGYILRRETTTTTTTEQ
ncbi:MAG: hypothetical protein Q9182_006707 [Xanthomendoza sp. 2 TL-2023]